MFAQDTFIPTFPVPTLFEGFDEALAVLDLDGVPASDGRERTEASSTRAPSLLARLLERIR